MRIISIIPARCGSKGFPSKNIMKVNGASLLEHAVNIGIESPIINDVYITTDCCEYEDIAIRAGAKSIGLRPSHLATDSAKTVDAIIHLLSSIKESCDYVILLQPTSPVRSVKDIANMMDIIQANNCDACVSVAKHEEPHPHKLKIINESGVIEPFLTNTSSEIPRQELPNIYALNGAIYLIKTSVLLNDKTFLPNNTFPYIMNENINIDKEEDYIFLKTMLDLGRVTLKNGYEK